MSQRDDEEFRLRDRIALRVMEHLMSKEINFLHLSTNEDVIEKIANLSYKMANTMCKARLKAFS